MTKHLEETLLSATRNSGGLVAAKAAALLPRSLEEAMRLAEMLAESDLVPKDFKNKPGNVLVAIQYGLELGLHPMQAVQSICVLNGRPCLWGDAVLGIVEASGLLEDLQEEFLRDGDRPEQVYARCTAIRRHRPTPIVRTFSWADAQRAGLAGKDNYKTYPMRMLQMRARSWALRDGFPDVLKGLQVIEEVRDYVEAVVESPEEPHAEVPMPRRKSESVEGSQEDAKAPSSPGPPSNMEQTGAASIPAQQEPESTAPPTEAQRERATLIGQIEAVRQQRRLKAQYFAHLVDRHCGGSLDRADVVALADLLLAVQAPAPEPLSSQKSQQMSFTIGTKEYQTAGIGKETLLQSFRLAEQVNKKAGETNLAKAMLKKHFGLESRTDLTEAQGQQYCTLLEEALRG